jgi:hypothetical protein
VGDLAAGTLMIYENRSMLNTHGLPVTLDDRRVDLASLELASVVLERWSALEPGARDRLARSLIERATGAAPDAGAAEAMLREQLERLAKPAPAERVLS